MTDLERRVQRVATDTQFSGVVRIDDADSVTAEWTFGFADRRHSIPNTVDTQFAIASGVKGLTALAVMSLVESGVLTLATTARSILGSDLPLIDDSVTIDHLLAHRSGVGDYLYESVGLDLSAYLMPVPCRTWPSPSSSLSCSTDIHKCSDRATSSNTTTADSLSSP